MGHTQMSEAEVEDLITELKKHWHGWQYDVLEHNCCHFADELVGRTAGVQVPTKIMNLAGAGAAIANGAERFAERIACGETSHGRQYVRTVCASVACPHSSSTLSNSGSKSSTTLDSDAEDTGSSVFQSFSSL